MIDGTEEWEPGPELAALLASIDRAGLGADDLLRVAVARQEAQLLADLHAVARAVPEDTGRRWRDARRRVSILPRRWRRHSHCGGPRCARPPS